MSDERELLRRTAEIAADFVESLDERPVWPPASVGELRRSLGGPLPDGPIEPLEVIEALSAAADPGVVGIPSGRYFGFVIGGGLPAALAADWLASTWDQNAGLVVGGPSAAVVEEVAGEWLKDLLGIPATASFSFVTGCQMAHVTCLAAARHAVLERVGCDVEESGLAGSPKITVVTGGRRHVTIDRALRLLGLGSGSTVRIDSDSQGRMLRSRTAQRRRGASSHLSISRDSRVSSRLSTGSSKRTGSPAPGRTAERCRSKTRSNWRSASNHWGPSRPPSDMSLQDSPPM